MKMRLLLFSLLGSLVAFATVNAQIPRTISYQGILADGSGTIVPNGSHTLTLSLYTNATGGSPIYTETQPVIVAKGVFSVSIGSVTPIPGSVAFNVPYYLGVSVDGGAELTPRTALGSVPYALHSSTADALSSSATGVVTNVNGQSGAITILGGGGTTVTNSGNTFTISSSGGGGTGIQGVQNADASIAVTNPNGPTASIAVASNGITTGKIADGAVTPAKLDATGSAAGNILTSNGTTVSWQPAPSSGLTLPFSGTVTSATDAFVVTNNGTAKAGYFIVNNSLSNAFALWGTTNGTGSSIGVYGGNTGAGRGGFFEITNAAGTGVALTGNTQGLGTSVFASNINAANSSNTLQSTTNGTGRAGSFTINNAANSAEALEATTNGSGTAIHGSNTIATGGSVIGILGEVASTSGGGGATAGVTGVEGKVTPTTAGGYSAGVRGINNGTSGTGIGVIGYQAGSGWGVYGETPSGIGVYGLTTNASAASSGVRGETFSANGIGVEAKYSGSGVGTALEIDNGGIRVAGTNKAAFIHTATVANKLSANGTDITNPMCDGDPNCLVFVTQRLGAGIVYNNSPVGVYYNTIRNKWEIFNENSAAIATGAIFHVLVIKQ